MRVTDQQRHRLFGSRIGDRLENMLRIQEQLGTGRRLVQPSDDTFESGRALQSEESISRVTQYKRNIVDGQNWLNAADSSLQNVVSLINEIDALAVAANNDAQTEIDRTNTAIQLDQKLEALVSLVNDSHNDRFLFGGHQTLSAPFSVERDSNGRITGATANSETISGAIYRRISANEDVRINVAGDAMFQPIGSEGTSGDIFHVITALRNTIANNNTPPVGEETTLSNEALRENLAQIRDRIVNQQSMIGGLGQRLENNLSRLMAVEIHLTDELEQAAGVDLTRLTSDLAVEESAYNALLAASPRFLRQSLVDYLL